MHTRRGTPGLRPSSCCYSITNYVRITPFSPVCQGLKLACESASGEALQIVQCAQVFDRFLQSHEVGGLLKKVAGAVLQQLAAEIF